MTCYNRNPCCPRPAGVVSGEPIASQLQNFIDAFYGSVEVVLNEDGSYSWVLPCDLNNGIVGWPPEEGEGTACLFVRIFNDILNQAITFNRVQLVNAVSYVVARMPYAGMIESVEFALLSGTASFSVQIDSVDVTGLTGLAASSTTDNAIATALNTFTAGQAINIETTAEAASVDFDMTLKIRRLPA